MDFARNDEGTESLGFWVIISLHNEEKEYGSYTIYRISRFSLSESLFDRMADLLLQWKAKGRSSERSAEEAYACANELLELAADYGFEGNLWHCFLSFCLANHENAYSTSCEIRAIWEVPCPIWQNRISRYLWICLPATSGN